MLPVIECPDKFLQNPDLLFKSSRLVTIGRIPSDRPGQPGLVLRRLNYGRFRHQLRDFFRPSRAFRAMRRSLALEQAGIPVPRALAVAEIRRCRWPVAAYFVSEEIAPTVTLRDYLSQNRRLPNGLVARLAEVFARLHSSGFTHGDTKSTNILLDSHLNPWLIDLDGVRQFSRTPDEMALRELARLACEARPHRNILKWSGLRFMLIYCRCRKRLGTEREWGTRVLRAMDRFVK